MGFGHVKILAIRNKAISKLYQHFRERGLPYGLQDALSTLSPSCSPSCNDSAKDPRLDTGGWLALTRRGLSPRKRRQASLGAITSRVSRSFPRPVGLVCKPDFNTSEGCGPIVSS